MYLQDCHWWHHPMICHFSLVHLLVLLVNHEVFASLFLFGAQISGCHSATLRLHVAWPRWEAWFTTCFPDIGILLWWVKNERRLRFSYCMSRNVYYEMLYFFCCCCCSCSCCCFDCARAKCSTRRIALGSEEGFGCRCRFSGCCRCRCCFLLSLAAEDETSKELQKLNIGPVPSKGVFDSVLFDVLGVYNSISLPFIVIVVNHGTLQLPNPRSHKVSFSWRLCVWAKFGVGRSLIVGHCLKHSCMITHNGSKKQNLAGERQSHGKYHHIEPSAANRIFIYLKMLNVFYLEHYLKPVMILHIWAEQKLTIEGKTKTNDKLIHHILTSI